MWQMAQLLASSKAEPDVQEHTADLDISGVALTDLLPDRTGFQVLTQPFTARGLGLRLKRKLLGRMQPTDIDRYSGLPPAEKHVYAEPHCSHDIQLLLPNILQSG